jgi:hypothetical protein
MFSKLRNLCILLVATVMVNGCSTVFNPLTEPNKPLNKPIPTKSHILIVSAVGKNAQLSIPNPMGFTESTTAYRFASLYRLNACLAVQAKKTLIPMHYLNITYAPIILPNPLSETDVIHTSWDAMSKLTMPVYGTTLKETLLDSSKAYLKQLIKNQNVDTILLIANYRKAPQLEIDCDANQEATIYYQYKIYFIDARTMEIMAWESILADNLSFKDPNICRHYKTMPHKLIEQKLLYVFGKNQEIIKSSLAQTLEKMLTITAEQM